MKKIKVGIIGCGVIGTSIAIACRSRLAYAVELAGVCDIDENKILALNRSLKENVRALKLDQLIKKTDLVIEASSALASSKIVEKCVENNRDCLIMSVGGLLGQEGLLKKAGEKGVKVYIPSGAVCGIDALKAASIGKIASVTLTTRKPPKGLEGAPYLTSKGIDVRAITKETVLFEGSARDAVKGFPANVNVSAVLSLAGIGAASTKVRIVTSPDYIRNTHEVEIIGDSGRITTRTENVPSESNPKTSALAIYSAIATLEGITRSVRIGT
ncbi:MAG: aspartate dehydrogenase [Candidatus Omnitrophica bacterium]|nr:aspartate dehydrogenase [Candidatus Omnitrophota bacterium]